VSLPPPAAAPVLVRLEQVEHLYHGRIRILGPLDLEIREGEFLSLVGPSGCGKSTLLRIVAGILPPSRGVVRLGDRPAARLHPPSIGPQRQPGAPEPPARGLGGLS
jgi:NitT/TauT family transport system ATP-binding protein